MFRMQNTVGAKVRQIRNSKIPKLTQSDLATQLQLLDWNIGRSGVAKIENGIRKVSDFEVIKLAKALNVSIERLFGQEQPC